MVVFPNAKINLGLNVVEKRNDGFHNIESLFFPIPLCDALEVLLSGNTKDEFTISGIKIEGDSKDNLILRTLAMLREKYEIPALKIHLLKKIPTGAGLGGGSSDAAFFMNLMNEMFGLNISVQERKDMIAKLGSDCSFFIENQTALAKGKGELLQPVSVVLKKHFLILVKPEVHVSTQDAYKSIIPKKAEKELMDIIKKPVSEWHHYLSNDFELPVFSKYPEIAEIKSKLYSNGAIYAVMSGSGSAVFGIFEKQTNLRKVFENNFYWEAAL